MDYDIEMRFQRMKKSLEEKFGEGMDVQAILFLIGVNELGEGYKNFTKNERNIQKMNKITTMNKKYPKIQQKSKN